MKKLLLSSLILLAPLSSISCKLNKNQEVNQTVVNKNFYQYAVIEKLLNELFNNNQILKKQYINQQENYSDHKIANLEYLLTLLPIFNPRDIRNNVSNFHIINHKAKEVLTQLLNHDWYWFLKNLNQFEYNFNPYNDRYFGSELEKILFKLFDSKDFSNQLKKQFQVDSLLINLESKIFSQIIEVDIENNNKLLNQNQYQDKKALYLIYDQNKAIKLLKYKSAEIVKYKVFPDLFVFKNTNNLREQITELENKINQNRNHLIDEEFSEIEPSYKKFVEDFKDDFLDDDIVYEINSHLKRSKSDQTQKDFEQLNELINKTFNSLNELVGSKDIINKQVFDNWKNIFINELLNDKYQKYFNSLKDKLSDNNFNSFVQKWSDNADQLLNKLQAKLPEIDVDKKFKLSEKHSDEKFYSFLEFNQYNSFLTETIDQINKVENLKNIKSDQAGINKILENYKILRYSWRSIKWS
ncbi:aromatic motif membrane protein [Mycoplasma yeatsii]|uniref:Aromatic cluster surface protein n=1 Tax=Mycoplasma yeatsii TaxID=51365 RepID=A0ABU0NE82_9MOLU|nr:aromatic motif membrane protein [Mycoplasma yeatsii]MDQ0567740.1 aromatic cluster surface protein [Mycoplasma yeatsii]